MGKRFSVLCPLIAGLCLLGACSATPKHYRAPSAAPVRESISKAQSSIAAAQRDVQQLSTLNSQPSTSATIVALNRHLFDAQNELRTANDRIVDLEQKVQDQTDALNVDEQKIKDLSGKSHFSILGIFSVVLQFVQNPFGFIVGRVFQIGVACIVACLILLAARYVTRRIRRKSQQLDQ